MYLLYTAFPKIYLCINGFPWKSFWFTAVADQERDLPNLMHYELHAQSKTKSITIKIKFENIWFDKMKFIFNYKYYEQVGPTMEFTWNVSCERAQLLGIAFLSIRLDFKFHWISSLFILVIYSSVYTYFLSLLVLEFDTVRIWAVVSLSLKRLRNKIKQGFCVCGRDRRESVSLDRFTGRKNIMK